MSDKPVIGSLRVLWVPQIGMPGEPFNVPVKTPEEGILILNTLADYDLYQFNNKVKGDYCNFGGLEVLEESIEGDDGWHTWYNEEGEDADDVMRRLREEEKS